MANRRTSKAADSAQNLFDFGSEDDGPPTAAPEQPDHASNAPKPGGYSWNWWDAWPPNISRREASWRQIQRDMRAIEEGDGMTEDELDFFVDRIAAHQAAIKKMDAGESKAPSNPQPADAPGPDR